MLAQISIMYYFLLQTLKSPIPTAADVNFCDIFPNLKKEGMKFHENRLPADDSHDNHAVFVIFEKRQQNLIMLFAANYMWRFGLTLCNFLTDNVN